MNRLAISGTILLTALSVAACKKFQEPAPVALYGSTQGAGSSGVHAVMGNETLWDISQRYQLAMRDVAAANNLSPPFDLFPGQRLRLPPPREYHVKAGDTLGSVSKVFNVPESEIARLNAMREPFVLKDGQTLRLPTLTKDTVPVVTELPPLPTVQQIARAPAAVPPPVSPAQPTIQRVPQSTYNSGGVGAIDPAPIQRETLAPPPAWQKAVDRETQVAQAPVVDEKPQPIQVAAAPAAKPEKKMPITAQVPKREGAKFLRPIAGKVISGYGPKKDGLHNDGINIASAPGAPVRAAENGVVVYAGNELKASGNLIIIRHQDKWMTAYAHMDKLIVKRGDTVKRGQTIGTVGSTGSVDTPQLHFEVRRGTEAINPQKYLDS